MKDTNNLTARPKGLSGLTFLPWLGASPLPTPVKLCYFSSPHCDPSRRLSWMLGSSSPVSLQLPETLGVSWPLSLPFGHTEGWSARSIPELSCSTSALLSFFRLLHAHLNPACFTSSKKPSQITTTGLSYRAQISS